LQANATFVTPDPAGNDVCAWATAHAREFELTKWSIEQGPLVRVVGLVCAVIGFIGYMITLLVFHRFPVDYAQPSLIYHKVSGCTHLYSVYSLFAKHSVNYLMFGFES
jgi:hypothetical protein